MEKTRAPHSYNSLAMRTVPRVPSNLRTVVAPELPDIDDETLEVDSIQASDSGRETSDLHLYQLPMYETRISHSPLLRRECSEPVLTNHAKRPASSIRCLPYPHTLDSYIQKQRPRSLNIHSNVSCRLSIVTVDQEYKQYSYKKQAEVAMHPSMFRGWMQRFGGKLMYSLGQLVASPTLILKGNHDITHGTIQMNMSRQVTARNKRKNKLSRKKVDSSSGTRKLTRNKSKSKSTSRELRRKYEESVTANNVASPTSQIDSKDSHISKDVVNCHAVGDVEIEPSEAIAVDMELSEAAYSLLVARQNGNANPVLDTNASTLDRGSRGINTDSSPLSGTTSSGPGEHSTSCSNTPNSDDTNNKIPDAIHDGGLAAVAQISVAIAI